MAKVLYGLVVAVKAPNLCKLQPKQKLLDGSIIYHPVLQSVPRKLKSLPRLFSYLRALTAHNPFTALYRTQNNFEVKDVRS